MIRKLSSRGLAFAYWFLVIGAVLIPGGVFLFLGYAAAGAVTAQNQVQVVAVMAGFLTVDGLLLGLSPRFREAFGPGDKEHRLANFFEAFQIGVLTISLMWSLVAMLYAAFSTDISLVSSWFKAALTAFFLAVSIYSSLAIMTRRGRLS
jgi:hypothetical protein